MENENNYDAPEIGAEDNADLTTNNRVTNNTTVETDNGVEKAGNGAGKIILIIIVLLIIIALAYAFLGHKSSTPTSPVDNATTTVPSDTNL